LALTIGGYLVACRTRLVSGDGAAYADQVASGLVSWNPNHLLMNPIAHAWTALVSAAPGDVPILIGLKILSGVAALTSVLLFHALLVALPVAPAAARVGLALGFFFSRSMLSMAVSEEFFVVQMPVLVVALGLCLCIARDQQEGPPPSDARLVAIGASVAVATCVSVNNVVLLAGLCAWVAGVGGRWRGLEGLRRAALVASGGAVILAPAFAAAYAASDADAGFLSWLVSYQGASGTELSRLYGFTANLRDALTALARLAFGFVNNVADGAGAGTLAKAVLRDEALEHVPDYPLAALGAAALLASTVACGLLLAWMARHRRDELVLLAAWWIAGVLAFNLFWDNSDDQFWFAILPVLWLCAARAAGFAPQRGSTAPGPRALAVLAAGVGFLLVANTAFVVAPSAFVDIERGRAEHGDLLAEGTVEIYPGWDHVTHLFSDHDPESVRRIALLDVALGRDDEIRMEALPQLVEAALRDGRRIVVARLYDRDRFAYPWEHLTRLGWPRERILKLLERFHAAEIARIDGLVFRELSLEPATERDDAGGSG
jgi:hypothetical protein